MFLKAATDNCVGNTVKCKNEIQGELQKVRLLTTKQEARFQSITDQLKNKVDSTSPSTQEESRPKWSHFESLRKTCSERHNTTEEDILLIKERLDGVHRETGIQVAGTKQNSKIDRIDGNVQCLQTRVEKVIEALENQKSQVQDTAERKTRPTPAALEEHNNLLQNHNNEDPISNIEDEAHQTPKDTQIPSTAIPIKLLVWTDSNGKGLNPKKFLETDGSLYETTYTIQDVNRKLDANRNSGIECV